MGSLSWDFFLSFAHLIVSTHPLESELDMAFPEDSPQFPNEAKRLYSGSTFGVVMYVLNTAETLHLFERITGLISTSCHSHWREKTPSASVHCSTLSA